MALGDLFLVSFIPVLKILLVCFVGFLLALDRVNILGVDARKYLNIIVFYVFSPALIGVNLAKTITYDSMIALWFMPVNVLIIFIIGSAFGWIINKVIGVPSKLRGLIVSCCSAGNLGNLLIIMVPTICKEKGSPFGAPDVCYTYGMGYASLSMALGSVYIWLYVYNIMRIYACEKTIGDEVTESLVETSKPHLLSCKEPLLSLQNIYISKEFGKELDVPPGSPDKISKVSMFVKFKQNLKILDEKVNFQKLFAPSTIAAIIAFIVGVVPQIRSLLFGDTAPLHVIVDSTSLLSDGAVPLLTLILGGNLVKGLKGSGIKISVIILIIVSRYILLPMCGILIIKSAIRFGLIHPDPLYQFVLLLQYTFPPAMNIGVISQLFGQGESECSLIMLWTYILAPVSLIIWSTTFTWMVT